MDQEEIIPVDSPHPNFQNRPQFTPREEANEEIEFPTP